MNEKATLTFEQGHLGRLKPLQLPLLVCLYNRLRCIDAEWKLLGSCSAFIVTCLISGHSKKPKAALFHGFSLYGSPTRCWMTCPPSTQVLPQRSLTVTMETSSSGGDAQHSQSPQMTQIRTTTGFSLLERLFFICTSEHSEKESHSFSQFLSFLP